MLARGEVVTGIAPDDLERWIAELHDKHAPFHWQLELTEVFSTERGGFDALLGNPPWVSYAGRAAQPLPDELRDLYAATSPAFHGYRNLQGLFIHRCASMLRPGGRLGLVVPTSMSDLDGYEPSRRAHDALSTCDDDLPDFGKDAFDGVFQPCMALLSTRLGQSRQIAKTGHWPLSRSDLDAETTALLDRLGSRPTFPKHLFGERGFQTIGDDVSRLHELEAPTDELPVALRVGSDVAPFRRRAPGLYCNPAALAGRLRPASAYEAVQVLIRQTARFPMAALSDGLAFRNSVLAGFAEEPWSCGFLVAYLNSTPVRWFHYMRHRDARQGMPQLKIAHLRALPAPPPEGRAALELGRIGRELGVRNRGIRTQEQAAIDALVADALDLDAQDRARIAAWGAAVRG